uniref:PAS domain-containing protein n=1 Tax=Chromera velia CCMP2878 TaxID=1169474 RepID=A0A0G4FUG2_9ALVE|eukprot:Cvel_18706.t1-p1 / transcript=Cvel_18706.t1 / gene=Cvel_18706 / organism=Chromera_velia_CCMP2878 / gene_product=hypothetical protein / transcript_product=hypothetical protein / location=Cvel_scaffold1567:20199-32952(-) / protein_length=1725 / sequence_SO=supercontig / SO=protein_coding / is_pseudo=false
MKVQSPFQKLLEADEITQKQFLETKFRFFTNYRHVVFAAFTFVFWSVMIKMVATTFYGEEKFDFSFMGLLRYSFIIAQETTNCWYWLKVVVFSVRPNIAQRRIFIGLTLLLFVRFSLSMHPNFYSVFPSLRPWLGVQTVELDADLLQFPFLVTTVVFGLWFYLTTDQALACMCVAYFLNTVVYFCGSSKPAYDKLLALMGFGIFWAVQCATVIAVWETSCEAFRHHCRLEAKMESIVQVSDDIIGLFALEREPTKGGDGAAQSQASHGKEGSSSRWRGRGKEPAGMGDSCANSASSSSSSSCSFSGVDVTKGERSREGEGGSSCGGGGGGMEEAAHTHRCVFVSPNIETVCGLSSDQIVYGDPNVLLDLIHEDDRPIFTEMRRRIVAETSLLLAREREVEEKRKREREEAGSALPAWADSLPALFPQLFRYFGLFVDPDFDETLSAFTQAGDRFLQFGNKIGTACSFVFNYLDEIASAAEGRKEMTKTSPNNNQSQTDHPVGSPPNSLHTPSFTGPPPRPMPPRPPPRARTQERQRVPNSAAGGKQDSRQQTEIEKEKFRAPTGGNRDSKQEGTTGTSRRTSGDVGTASASASEAAPADTPRFPSPRYPRDVSSQRSAPAGDSSDASAHGITPLSIPSRKPGGHNSGAPTTSSVSSSPSANVLSPRRQALLRRRRLMGSLGSVREMKAEGVEDSEGTGGSNDPTRNSAQVGNMKNGGPERPGVHSEESTPTHPLPSLVGRGRGTGRQQQQQQHQPGVGIGSAAATADRDTHAGVHLVPPPVQQRGVTPPPVIVSAETATEDEVVASLEERQRAAVSHLGTGTGGLRFEEVLRDQIQLQQRSQKEKEKGGVMPEYTLSDVQECHSGPSRLPSRMGSVGDEKDGGRPSPFSVEGNGETAPGPSVRAGVLSAEAGPGKRRVVQIDESTEQGRDRERGEEHGRMMKDEAGDRESVGGWEQDGEAEAEEEGGNEEPLSSIRFQVRVKRSVWQQQQVGENRGREKDGISSSSSVSGGGVSPRRSSLSPERPSSSTSTAWGGTRKGTRAERTRTAAEEEQRKFEETFGVASSNYEEGEGSEDEGGYIFCDVSAKVVSLDPLHYSLCFKNVTSRVAEQHKMISLLEAFANTVKMSAWCWDTNDPWRKSFITSFFQTVTGRSPDDTSSLTNMLQDLQEPGRSRLMGAVSACMRDGSPYAVELEYERKDGEANSVEAQQRVRLQRLADSEFDGWGVADLQEHMIVEASAGMNLLFGRRQEGAPLSASLPADLIREVTARGVVTRHRCTVRYADARATPMAVEVTAFLDQDDPAVMVYGIRRVRRKAERAGAGGKQGGTTGGSASSTSTSPLTSHLLGPTNHVSRGHTSSTSGDRGSDVVETPYKPAAGLANRRGVAQAAPSVSLSSCCSSSEATSNVSLFQWGDRHERGERERDRGGTRHANQQQQQRFYPPPPDPCPLSLSRPARGGGGGGDAPPLLDVDMIPPNSTGCQQNDPHGGHDQTTAVADSNFKATCTRRMMIAKSKGPPVPPPRPRSAPAPAAGRDGPAAAGPLNLLSRGGDGEGATARGEWADSVQLPEEEEEEENGHYEFVVANGGSGALRHSEGVAVAANCVVVESSQQPSAGIVLHGGESGEGGNTKGGASAGPNAEIEGDSAAAEKEHGCLQVAGIVCETEEEVAFVRAYLCGDGGEGPGGEDDEGGEGSFSGSGSMGGGESESAAGGSVSPASSHCLSALR